MSIPPSKSNLPRRTSDGVFAVSASVIINAPREKVWQILMDFPKYSEWNPLVRAQTLVSPTSSLTPLPNQLPTVGAHLLIFPVHVPPTMDDASVRFPSSALERITAMDHENYRCAWLNIQFPAWLLKSERWQVLGAVVSEGEQELTKYESVEVFEGVLAYMIKWSIRDGLAKGFQAMGEALKKRAEES